MSIEDDIVAIERVPSLRSLGREAIRILAIGAESRILPAGEVLFTVGETADCGYIVQQGSIVLQSDSKSLGENVVGPGTLLGELALITETKRPVTAMATEPATVIRISRSLFLKMLEGYPQAAHVLREQVLARAREAVSEMSSVRGRLDTSLPPADD